MPSFLKIVIALCGMVAMTACQTAQPIDQSAMHAARPRSILVLPPMNNSVEVNASYTFLATITRPLAEKGYYVFPVAVIDLFMKENGLPTPEEMNNVPLHKLVEHIGADSVLYIDIKNWGQKYQVIASTAVVNADMRLVNAHTGEELWSGHAEARHSNDNSEQGISGMLLGAVVDQVLGSMVDETFNMSRKANYQLIHDEQRGLIDGPYLEAKSH